MTVEKATTRRLAYLADEPATGRRLSFTRDTLAPTESAAEYAARVLDDPYTGKRAEKAREMAGDVLRAQLASVEKVGFLERVLRVVFGVRG